VRLAGAFEACNDYTGKASEIVRQLGFAAIALVWALKPEGGEDIVPGPLRPGTMLAVLALSLDLLQYVVGSFIWRRFARRKELEFHGSGIPEAQWEEQVFTAPSGLNQFTTLLFWGKIVAILGAYFAFLLALALGYP